MEHDEKKRLIKQAMMDARGYQKTEIDGSSLSYAHPGYRCPDNERTDFWVQQIIDGLLIYFSGDVFEAQKNPLRAFKPTKGGDHWYEDAFVAGMIALCNIEKAEKGLLTHKPTSEHIDAIALKQELEHVRSMLGALEKENEMLAARIKDTNNSSSSLDTLLPILEKLKND